MCANYRIISLDISKEEANVMRVEHALNLKLGISTCCIILMEYLKVGRDL